MLEMTFRFVCRSDLLNMCFFAPILEPSRGNATLSMFGCGENASFGYLVFSTIYFYCPDDLVEFAALIESRPSLAVR